MEVAAAMARGMSPLLHAGAPPRHEPTPLQLGARLPLPVRARPTRTHVPGQHAPVGHPAERSGQPDHRIVVGVLLPFLSLL
jgi:hypothetical protein